MRVAVFGSVARGQATRDSDLDVMVRIDPAARLDVYGYVALTQYIGDLSPMKVDVANEEGLKPQLRARIEQETPSMPFEARRSALLDILDNASLAKSSSSVSTSTDFAPIAGRSMRWFAVLRSFQRQAGVLTTI